MTDSPLFDPLPEGPFDVIYADPPWRHDLNMMVIPYNTLATDEIASLDVAAVAADDCVLFLWAVSPMLRQALDVGEAWGFEYSTVGFVWDKRITNPGNYTLSRCETCLIFKRGRIPQPRGARNVPQFLSLRRLENSRKPPHFRHRIDAMFPAARRLELFARERGEGWEAWGNQLTPFWERDETWDTSHLEGV